MATMLIPPTTEPALPASEEDRAVARLRDALEGWWRAEDVYEAALGTSSELASWARLCAARDEVAARDRWLRWAEQDDDLLVIPPARPPI